MSCSYCGGMDHDRSGCGQLGNGCPLCAARPTVIDMTAPDYLGWLIADVEIVRSAYPSYALPPYELAHADEWVTTFLRPVEDF